MKVNPLDLEHLTQEELKAYLEWAQEQLTNGMGYDD